MTTMDDLIQTVLELIEREAGIDGASYTPSFVSSRIPNPLTHPRIAAGLESVRMSAGAMGQYLSGETYGNRAEVALKIKVYMPEERGGDLLNEILSRICGILLTGGQSLGIHTVSCGEVNYETASMAYTISCRAELVTYIGEAEDDHPVTEVVIKTK